MHRRPRLLAQQIIAVVVQAVCVLEAVALGLVLVSDVGYAFRCPNSSAPCGLSVLGEDVLVSLEILKLVVLELDSASVRVAAVDSEDLVALVFFRQRQLVVLLRRILGRVHGQVGVLRLAALGPLNPPERVLGAAAVVALVALGRLHVLLDVVVEQDLFGAVLASRP